MVVVRQKQNIIFVLIYSDGNKLISYSQITNKAVNFFQNLLGTTDANVSGCSKGLLAELLTDTLSNEAATDLVRLVSPVKVKATMFSIDGGRALGLDGFIA